ncbi:beta-lactamase family protein [Corynebacterium sp. 153RC1]|uniref:serine hydrolase domain-containing protein n=1 Tax=unclassified Corynebacterium TaxID=2624378 RepID=UPI00211C588F|nr:MULTISPECIES: serine hydrolase domain-containing protein [unclassified Corynebacterium]MCQ9369939.1 beta-lactamase family protein [Corynebacterium sp. 35RC1]MCQ9352058.1 beta-lactamase family protein [Corynebacterium sp. 209RC1]MCQ9353807.1 beta-lactamase family protein [Corynebacterium sp. 1222RC1]MCQ9356209.1 beta-lactamase family protein [Corynebacterium sp. 122RC1]MCQ9358311.1 beta-lactamase family protein [Corynebacterium sp. 142RC1]
MSSPTTNAKHIKAHTWPRILLIIVVLAALLFFGVRPIMQSREFQGSEALATTLSERAPTGTHRLAVIENGTFAGLGATADDEFEIGSVTKMMTIELLRQAIERGEVSLDTPVATLIEFPNPEITLEDLANHTAGVKRIAGTSVFAPILGRNPYANTSTQDVLNEAAAAESRHGADKDYSNFGYAILGTALAEAAGHDYPTLMEQRIFTPLRMENTFVATVGSLNSENPRGYNEAGHKAAAWEMDGYAPAGAVRSTANDLEIFVRHVLDHGVPEYGWVHTDDGLAWHNGKTGGFSSQVVLRPTTGQYMLALADTTASPDALLLEMMRETPDETPDETPTAIPSPTSN